MGVMLKKLIFATDKEGKQFFSVLRFIATSVSTLLIGALFTWGTWVHNQAYTVAINKENIGKTAARLEKDIGINAQDIILNHGEIEDRLDKMNQILHMRITKVDDKYDAKITKLQELLMETNKLVVEILMQKNREVEIEKESLEMQQKQSPKWPVSPNNGD